MVRNPSAATIRDFAVSATGVKILKDFGRADVKLKGKDIIIGAAGVKGSTEAIGNVFACEMQRFPRFKEQINAMKENGKKYVFVDKKGELVLTSRRQILGFGRHRMKVEELMKRAVPEYIEGTMGRNSVSFARMGAEFRIYNQMTGAEERIEFSNVLKAELLSVAGGKKIRIRLKDGRVIEIIVPELADPGKNKKMFSQIEYWIENKKR